jgi:hypothetical protein
MPPVGVTSESSFAVGQSALRSSGTSPNFRISLASLKSPLDVPGPQREHAAYRLRPTLLRPSRATSILPPTRPSRPAAETPGRRCREATPGDGSQGRANARMRQMSEVTYYVALPFVFSDDGMAAGEAAECLSANAAVMRAEALSRKPGHAGAIAFSRTGDPSSGDFSGAKLIRKFGDVPDDLSTL